MQIIYKVNYRWITFSLNFDYLYKNLNLKSNKTTTVLLYVTYFIIIHRQVSNIHTMNQIHMLLP